MAQPAERMAPRGDGVAAAMPALYDAYYRSSDYRRRYPKPNRATLDLLFAQGAQGARNILDFGCGNGRYTLPLLQRTAARISAYDISRGALDELQTALEGLAGAERVTTIHGDPAQLDAGGPYDLVLLLFGVLSHIGNRAERMAALHRLRRLTADGGRLILSVPNILRRRPVEVVRAALRRVAGTAEPTLAEPGDIVFRRRIASAERQFFYHLYSAGSLRDELHEAGFRVLMQRPESLLPEWAVTQSDRVGAVDAALVRWLPASLGYCMSVVAETA